MKKKLSKKFKELSTMKKLLIISAVMLVVMSGSATAIWLLQIQDGLTANVVSVEGGTVSFTTTLNDLELDTTTSEDSASSTAVISNNNGNLTMLVQIEENKIDVQDDCTDYLNDVQATYKIDSEKISNNETITLESGDSNLTVIIDAASHSCPQSLGLNITLTEV